MNIENDLDQLKNIVPQEAPPQLLARIRQRIAAAGETAATPAVKWMSAAAAVLILGLNIFIVSRSSARERGAADNIVNGMQLSPSNQLYHE